MGRSARDSQAPGHPRDLAATERNLQVLAELAPRSPSPELEGAGARPPVLRPLPAIVMGTALFGAGLAGGAIVGGSGGKQAAAITTTDTKTKTVAQNGTTQTVTEKVPEPVVETATNTVTVIETVTAGEEPIP